MIFIRRDLPVDFFFKKGLYLGDIFQKGSVFEAHFSKRVCILEAIFKKGLYFTRRDLYLGVKVSIN